VDPKWGLEVREGTHAERTETDERPFWLVLNYVRELGIEGYRELRRSGEVAPQSFDRSVRRLLNIPESFRFRYVAIRGRFRDPSEESDLAENPGEIEMLASALLIHESGELVRLVSPVPWAEHEATGLETPVLVEGVFYKRWGYVTPSGEKKEIPLVIVTTVYPGRE
jgi:hypothetical protein